MKCIAIDNDAVALSQISAYIEKEDNLQLLAKFENTQDAQKYLIDNEVKPDVIFVEANMPELSGIDLIKSLMFKPKVVIMSSVKDYAYDAMKIQAVDYILKPFSYNDFKAAVTKCDSFDTVATMPTQRFLFIKSEYKVMRIELDKIKFIESMREYVRFHVEGGRPIMSLITIKAIENYLPKNMFMRVHRSYIINLNKIDVIERARIVFDGDTFIPISEQYKDKFQEYLDSNFAI